MLLDWVGWQSGDPGPKKKAVEPPTHQNLVCFPYVSHSFYEVWPILRYLEGSFQKDISAYLRHQELCHESLQPNVVTLGALVSSCESCSAWRQGLRIFRDLQAWRSEWWVTPLEWWRKEKPTISREFWCLKLLEMVKKYEETPDFRICLLTYVRRNMLKKW